jgi:hypothetical protein
MNECLRVCQSSRKSRKERGACPAGHTTTPPTSYSDAGPAWQAVPFLHLPIFVLWSMSAASNTFFRSCRSKGCSIPHTTSMYMYAYTYLYKTRMLQLADNQALNFACTCCQLPRVHP